MTIVRRYVWESTDLDEDWHEVVELAVDADGTSPAEEFLQALKEGEWDEDPEHNPPHDDEQIHDYHALLAKIEYVGRHGTPMNSTAVRDLEQGIWEFKHGARRLTYWDTPGDGTFTPKYRYKHGSERPSPCPPGGYWWYPIMDTCLRLGVAWPKTGEAAPPSGIQAAINLREEDCAHDR